MRMLYIPDRGNFRKIPLETAYGFKGQHSPAPLVFDRWDFRKSKYYGYFAAAKEAQNSQAS